MQYQEFKVGEIAWLPSIAVDWRNEFDCPYKGHLPLYGPLHTDEEISFPPKHRHIDLRFVDEEYMAMNKIGLLRVVRFDDLVQDIPGYVKRYPPILERQFTCLRAWPHFPQAAIHLPFLNELMAETRMRKMICPHKGVPLTGCPVQNGVVTCPAHGLHWNVETGELVK